MISYYLQRTFAPAPPSGPKFNYFPVIWFMVLKNKISLFKMRENHPDCPLEALRVNTEVLAATENLLCAFQIILKVCECTSFTFIYVSICDQKPDFFL